MASNNAFTLAGAISSKLGFDSNANYGIKPRVSTPAPVSQPQPVSNVQQGNNPGLIKPTAPVTKTVDAGGTTTHYATKPNPSVLEQQKMLNKTYGAGLVEDGISGPKTREAITRYLTSGTNNSIPSAPVSSTPPPPPLTVAGQTPGLIQSGQQTSSESDAMKRLQEAGGITPWEQDIRSGSAVNEANQKLADFRQKVASKYADIEGQAIPLNFQQGREQALARQFASQENALQQAVGNALTNQGQQFQGAQAQASRGLTSSQGLLSGAQTQAQRGLSAYSTALGVLAPQFPSYSSQVIQPGLLDSTTNQGGGLQDAVSNVVKKLTNGQMTYQDAVSALSGYGQGGLNALQQALPSNFNVAQSNTLSGQQGSVGVNYQLADTALKNAEGIMNQLGLFTNIPFLNKARTFASLQTGIGAENTRAYIGAIQSLRNAYASLLASAKGGTPTDYSNQAMAEIPDIPTSKDLQAIRKNFETLGQKRKEILGNPGQASGSTTGGGFAEQW